MAARGALRLHSASSRNRASMCGSGTRTCSNKKLSPQGCSENVPAAHDSAHLLLRCLRVCVLARYLQLDERSIALRLRILVLLNEPVQVSLQPPATPGRMLVAFLYQKKGMAGRKSQHQLTVFHAPTAEAPGCAVGRTRVPWWHHWWRCRLASKGAVAALDKQFVVFSPNKLS
jgi:hypothetical protein